jgi:dUTP pyrophosphatase
MPVRVDGPGLLPTRAYATDAGLDLYVSERTTVPAGGFSDVPAGISCELGEHQWGLVTGRSSALRERGLLIHSGIIDSGYRGPLFAGAFNLGQEPVTLEAGERVAQLIVMHNATRLVDPFPVETLSESPRGTRGFGSSGT